MKKPRRGAGLSSLRGLAEMRVNGKPTEPYHKKPRQGAGLSLVDPSLWACRGGGKPTLSTPSRTVGFCVENPSTKKAPPKRG